MLSKEYVLVGITKSMTRHKNDTTINQVPIFKHIIDDTCY